MFLRVKCDSMPQRMTHLLPHERRIWRKFSLSPPFTLDDVTFDLHLGRGVPLDPDWSPEIQYMATTLTQKRIDVVARSGGDVWILEIKRRAGFSCLGQLLGYGVLFEEEFAPSRPPRLAVIAENVMPDIMEILVEFGISLFLV